MKKNQELLEEAKTKRIKLFITTSDEISKILSSKKANTLEDLKKLAILTDLIEKIDLLGI